MRASQLFRLLILPAILLLAGQSSADELYEDFAELVSGTTYTDHTLSSGWFIDDAAVQSSITPTSSIFLDASGNFGTNGHVRTPYLNYGLGNIALHVGCYAGKPIAYVAEYSTDTTNWTHIATYTNNTQLSASAYPSLTTHSLNVYSAGYVRIRALNPGATRFLRIDDIQTYDPPAKVDIGTITLDPPAPGADTPVLVSVELTPSLQASNLTVELDWWIPGGATNTMAMTNGTGNSWIAVDTIDGQEGGVSVYFDITVTYEGPYSLSPSTASSSYRPTAPAFTSGYATMGITGSASAPMLLVANHTWEAVVQTSGGTYAFEGETTNTPSATHTWGDASQTDTTIPIEQTAAIGEGTFSVDSLAAGQLLMRLNDTSGSYRVNSAIYQHFDGWTGAGTSGDHDLGEWQVRDGAVDNLGTNLQLRGQGCLLDPTGYARSASLPDGVGHVAFWFRNATSNGTPLATFELQVSDTGSSDPADWTTLATNANISSIEYNRYQLPLNTRYFSYVRILNTGSAGLAIDELLIEHAGSGIQVDSTTTDPAPPAASDPVDLYANISSLDGASISQVTLFYRTKGQSSYASMAMDATSNDTYRSASNIPAGWGDAPDGSGTVEYYLATEFDGVDAAYGSPAYFPRAGAQTPASFEILPSQVTISNVTLLPDPIYTGTRPHVQADVDALYGAYNLDVTLYHRTGTSGEFSAIEMVTNAPGSYITSLALPAQEIPGTRVEYYIYVSFSGSDALSPTNAPAAGASAPDFYITRQGSYDTTFESMRVEGDISGTMTLVADHTWQLVTSVTAPSGIDFRFVGQTNAVDTTFRDTDQTYLALPVYGATETNGVDITVTDAINGYLQIRFNETNGFYSVKSCISEPFSGWAPSAQTFGNHVNGEWSIEDGRIETNLTGAIDGAYTRLNNTDVGFQWIDVDNLSGGVGDISFYYRNVDQSGALPSSIQVQTYNSGIGEWRTVKTFDPILSADWLFATIPLSDHFSSAMRLSVQQLGTKPYLDVDQVTIAAPGPTVSFTNLTHFPSNPTITNMVDVSVEITPVGAATNLSPVLWYRAGSNGTYQAIPMSGSAPTFTNNWPIPRTQPGTVEYYVACHFEDPLGNPLSVLHPLDSTGDPATYTVTDELSLFEDFSTWDHSTSPPPHLYTTNGWTLTDSNVGFGPADYIIMIGAVFSGEDYTNSTMQLPYQPYGVGSVIVSATAFDNNALPYMEYNIETSTNGTDWVVSETVYVTDHSRFGNFSFGTYTSHINIYEGTYVRITTPVTAESTWLLINSVTVSYPPAYVAADGFLFSPGYPSEQDPISVSCVITSATTFLPASGISAQLYYRTNPNDPWSGPLAMTPDGDRFTSTELIPPAATGSTVEYYVESSFDGYFYQTGLSPMSFPDSAEPLAVDIRRYRSNISRISVDTGGDTYNMRQSEDYEWEFIINYRDPTTNQIFNLTSHDLFDGETIIPGIHTNWGDAFQERFEVPFGSTLQAGATPISADGPLVNQYLLRVNEESLSYSLQECLYQDYELWASHFSLFDSTLTGLSFDSEEQNFNAISNWPPSSTSTHVERFGTNTFPYAQDYPYTGGFSADPAGGVNTRWAIVSGVVITQYVGEGVMLDSISGLGYVRHATGFQAVDGSESLSLDVRASDNQDISELPHPTYYDALDTLSNIMVEATLYSDELPINSWPQDDEVRSFGYSEISTIIRRIDDNNYYELSQRQLYDDVNNRWNRHTRLFCTKAGTRSLIWQRTVPNRDLSLPVTYRVILDNYNGDYLYYLIYENGGFVANGFTGNAAHRLPVEGGSFGFAGMDTSILVDGVVAGSARIMHFNNWPNQGSYIITTRDGWTASNAKIDGGTVKLRPYDTSGTLDMAYLKSPIMHDGIGHVSLIINKTSGTHGTLLLQYSTTGGTDESEWTTFESFDVTQNLGRRSLDVDVNIPNVYFRAACYNDTPAQTSAEIQLDQVFLQPHREIAYNETFDGTATDWTDPGNTWVASSNGVYRRPAYNGPPLTLGIEYVGWDNAGGSEAAWPWQSITNIPITHGNYVNYTIPIEIGNNIYLRARHKSGTGHLILDNLVESEGWRGDTVSAEGWEASEAWFFPTGESPYFNACELRRSRASTGSVQQIESPELPSLGSLSFFFRTEDGPVTFKVDQASAEDPDYWDTILPETTIESETWAPWSYAFNDPDGSFIRIIHTSTNRNTALYIDNIAASEFAELGDTTWRSYNALITAGQPERTPIELDNLRAGFLNNSPTNDTVEPFYDNTAFVESAALSNGIGELSFWYRSWDGSPTTIRVLGSPDRNFVDSAWTELDRIANITSSTYTRYKRAFFEPELRYLRLTLANEPGLARACTDNILVTAPLGASFSIRNLNLDPPIPTADDAVSVSCETYNYILSPSNIVMTLYWRTGTNAWGTEVGANTIPMHIASNDTNSIWYETDGTIDPQPINTVVQYWIKAEFDGVFSENSSPREYKQFTPPEHHYPVNLNTNQSSTIPYYFSFSCLPGQVWINEVNLNDKYGWADSVGQFVELCGIENTDIGNWKLRVMNTSYTVTESFTIPGTTSLPSDTNRFGFFVIGDDDGSVANLDLPSTTDWPLDGGFQLFRSVGTLEHAVCYSSDEFAQLGRNMTNNPAYRFVHIGVDDTFWGEAGLDMNNTGSNVTDFVWYDHFGGWSAGRINDGQTLIPWPDTPIDPGDAIVMEIKNVVISGGRVHMVVQADTSDLVLTPMATTNLLDTAAWTPAPNPSIAATGTTYTVSCDLISSQRGAFYMVTTPAPETP